MEAIALEWTLGKAKMLTESVYVLWAVWPMRETGCSLEMEKHLHTEQLPNLRAVLHILLDSEPSSAWAPEENLASIPWGRGKHRGAQAGPFIYVLCVPALMLQGQDWVLVT